MNSSRTHQSHALAFRSHTDYACALTVSHESFLTRVGRWLRAALRGQA